MPTTASSRTERTRSKPVAELPPMPATPVITVTEDDVALRAFEIYCERGCEDGHDVEDWLQAERELRSLPGAHVREN